MSLLKLRKISNKNPQWVPILQDIIEKIKSVEDHSKVFIFGSFVHDKLNYESDLDLAVIIPDHKSVKDFLNTLYSKGQVSKWPLDLLVFNESHFAQKSQEGGVCFDIREDGIELFPNWSLDVTA